MKRVLITSLCRRNFDDGGKIRRSLQAYADVVKDVAKEMDLPLIDLHERSITVCEALGPDGCKPLSPLKDDGTLAGYPDSWQDGIVDPDPSWEAGDAAVYQLEISLADSDDAQGKSASQAFAFEARTS